MKFSHRFKDFVEKIIQLPDDFLKQLRQKAEAYYHQPTWCTYPPLGMYVIGVLRHACSSENLTRFYEQLQEQNQEFLTIIGFEKMPAYSTLAHFFNTRIGGCPLEFITRGEKLLEQACFKAGRTLGRLRSTDGKVMASTHREAVFNPHYETTMYKGLIDWDLELFVPLKAAFASGTANERPFCKRSHRDLTHLKTELDVLDGGYYGFGLYCLNRNTPTLIYFPEGTAGSADPAADLQTAYREHWKDSEYDANASLENQLRFLTRKGDTDAVGRFYRDSQILESLTNPDEYARKKHVRAWVETGNSRLDNRGMSNRVKHASEMQAQRDLFWTCHALQVEALVELTAK